MRTSRTLLLPVLALFLALAPLAAPAQSASSSRATSDADRLFLAFAEDATVVGDQWWEGQLEFSDGESVDLTVVRGIFAFRPWKDLEVGGRVGFGDSDIPGSGLDGSGATDLEAWGKYYLPTGADATEFAVGGVVTVPTGDDTAALGNDAFSFEAFGAIRRRLERVVLSAHAGVQLNGDGSRVQRDLSGETSPRVGVGLIVPLSDELTVVGEAVFKGESFDGLDSDSRILGGVTWRPFNRGMFRGAIAVGLSDGAPDAQVIAGYAVNF